MCTLPPCVFYSATITVGLPLIKLPALRHNQLYFIATMPIKFQKEAANFKYLLFVDVSEGRRTIIMITGICSMEECFTFISKYPTRAITPDKKQAIPHSNEHFQHEVTVNVRGFNTEKVGQKMPEWLEHLTDQFGGTMRFSDSYTFHIARRFMLAHTGEDLEDM